MSRLDFTQPPFDVLSGNERALLKKHAKILYLAKQQLLADTQYPYFYVVLKGRIQQRLNGDAIGEFVASTYSNDWFDARKQPDGRIDSYVQPNVDDNTATDHYQYQAIEDSLLLQVDAQTIDKLSRQNQHIRNLLSGELAQRMQAYHERTKSGGFAYTRRQSQSTQPYPSNGSQYFDKTARTAVSQSVLTDTNTTTSKPASDQISVSQTESLQPTVSDLAANPSTLTEYTDLDNSLNSSNSNHNQSGAVHTQHSHNNTAFYSVQAESQQLMLQPVTAISMLEVHTIHETASLYEAASTMTKAGLKHVLVKRMNSIDRHPTRSSQSSLGILTDADICRAVSERLDLNTTLCRDYAKFKLHTINYDQDVSEALLAMIRHRVHRLPVLDANQDVIGVLGQSDLLAFLSHHSQLITVQIEQADSIESLKQPVEQIGRYIRSQHHNGIKIGVISRIVQALNAHVFAKLWRLIVPEMVFNNTCIIVMGSEGRGEQIMRTDQDNALIIRNGFSDPNLEHYAEQFNQTLAQMGYPLCDGKIMMNNPQWRLPLNRFKSQVTSWFHQSQPEHAIWLSSLLDASYVCGDERLLDSLRKHLQVAHRSADPMFIRSFAQAALQFGDVNQWWKKFMPLIGKPLDQDIDLKKVGIFPLVHGIRSLALESDIFDVTSSKARLQALARAEVITPKRAETLNEVLEFFMARRLDIALATEDKTAHEVDPTTLSALERDLLKECLNVVKGFKNDLRHRYQLEVA